MANRSETSADEQSILDAYARGSISRKERDAEMHTEERRRQMKAALRDFSKLPHVEFDHWTTDSIESMVSQAESQIDLVSEAIADPFAAGYEAKPSDVKKLRAFVRKWKPFSSDSNLEESK